MENKELLYAIMSACSFMLCNFGAKLSLTPGLGWVMAPVYGGAALSYWLFRRACESNGLAVTSSVIDTLVTVISVLIGLFVLHEQLNQRQYVGLAALFIGLYLIR